MRGSVPDPWRARSPPPEPPATQTRGELLARGGGLVVIAAGGLVLGAVASARAAGGGDLATLRLLHAGELIAIAFYERAGAAGVLSSEAAAQAQATLQNERDHDAALREAGGPAGLGGRVVLSRRPRLLGDAGAAMASAVALESALAAAYMGAAARLDSADLRGLAAAVGANEAQHLDALRRIAAGRPVAGPALPPATGPERARADLAAFAAGGRLP